MTAAEVTYAYRVPSRVRRISDRSELLLGTSGGRTETGPAACPYLFQGFLTDPGPAALGMLACAAIAGARYYTPASVVAAIRADPVVTSHGGRLRFESFSGCCGVHARLDLLPSALEGAPVAAGTTNVDFNAPIRAALAGVAAGGPLLLSVGADEVRVIDRRGVGHRAQGAAAGPLAERLRRGPGAGPADAPGRRTGLAPRRSGSSGPSRADRGARCGRCQPGAR